MRRLVYFLILGLSVLAHPLGAQSIFASDAALKSLILYTEDNPPFNYEEKGVAKGAGVELLLKIFEHLDVDKTREDIVVLPWARGYTETQRRKNTLLFSTVRTPAREALFKWVGPISNGQVVLLARAENTLPIADPHDFMKYSYGVSQASREEQILLDLNVNPANFLYVPFGWPIKTYRNPGF